jgi:hypothetical protein
MDAVTIDTLTRDLRTNAWIPLIAVIVGAVIRLTKTDAAVAWFKVYTKPEHRPAIALSLAIVGASVERLAVGGTWYDAIAGGIAAGSLAIAGHELYVNGIRKGRDIGIKKAPPPPPPDWLDDSLRPPLTKSPPPSSWPLVGGAILALSVAGCPGAGRVVCPVIDLASQVCPYILVKLPDGSTEPVRREVIEGAAIRARVTRMRAAELDPNPYIRDGGAE